MNLADNKRPQQNKIYSFKKASTLKAKEAGLTFRASADEKRAFVRAHKNFLAGRTLSLSELKNDLGLKDWS